MEARIFSASMLTSLPRTRAKPSASGTRPQSARIRVVLPGAVGAQKPKNLTFPDLHAHALDGRKVAEANRHIVGVDDGRSRWYEVRSAAGTGFRVIA